MSGFPYEVSGFGERGWLATFDAGRNIVAGGLFANQVADQLRATPGVTDAVAGINSVAVRFAPEKLPAQEAQRLLEREMESAGTSTVADTQAPIEIPICYGGEFGPDLADTAEMSGMTEDAVIEAHCATLHRVVTLGFAPGFAYLAGLDPRLTVARLDTPRKRLSAGSVGIAAGLTGIYPLASPGGWRIIGRTPAQLFDPDADRLFLLRPGVRVQFKRIDQDSFSALHSSS